MTRKLGIAKCLMYASSFPSLESKCGTESGMNPVTICVTFIQYFQIHFIYFQKNLAFGLYYY